MFIGVVHNTNILDLGRNMRHCSPEIRTEIDSVWGFRYEQPAAVW